MEVEVKIEYPTSIKKQFIFRGIKLIDFLNEHCLVHDDYILGEIIKIDCHEEMKVFGSASDDFCKLRKLILQQIDVNMDYNEILEHCFIVGEGITKLVI